jgi:hypothetical protein
MASPTASLRQRNPAAVTPKKKDASATGIAAPKDPELEALVKANLNSKSTGSEWDYKLALAIITIAAFVTRFWGISHPNEVVFDEVHFGKVRVMPCRAREQLLIRCLHSLHRIICSAHISSMSTLHWESSCLPSWDGSLGTTDTSSSTILATPISPTRFHTLHSGLCQHFLAP